MTTYYVDGAVGNDSNAGTSEGSGNAWATIQKAADTAVAGDIVYIKASATYTLTVQVDFDTNSGDTTSGPICFEGYATTAGARDGRPTVTSATNSVALFALNGRARLQFRHLEFTHTAATRGSGILGTSVANSHTVIDDCIFDGLDAAIEGASRTTDPRVVNCVIKNCTSTSGAVRESTARFNSTLFLDNSGAGYQNPSATSSYSFIGCVFDGNDYGIRDQAVSRNNQCDVVACVFVDQTNDAIEISKTTGSIEINCFNSIFYGNGGYGIQYTGASAQLYSDLKAFHNNAFGSNTAGDYTGVPTAASIDEVSLTADPFTDKANQDYSLNSTAGGGTACKAAGIPSTHEGTTFNVNIGTAQESGGGGGGTTSVLGIGGLKGGFA